MSHGKAKGGEVATCPACGSHLTFRKQPRRGQFITCHECDSLLEVVWSAPLKLEWAFEEPLGVEYDDRQDFAAQAEEWDPEPEEDFSRNHRNGRRARRIH